MSVVKADQIIPLKDEFFERLNKKNSWGKNEVKELFLNTVIDVTFNAYKGASKEGTQVKPDTEIQHGRWKSNQLPIGQEIPKTYDKPSQINQDASLFITEGDGSVRPETKEELEKRQGFPDSDVF
jgi:hypothetical protein